MCIINDSIVEVKFCIQSHTLKLNLYFDFKMAKPANVSMKTQVSKSTYRSKQNFSLFAPLPKVIHFSALAMVGLSFPFTSHAQCTPELITKQQTIPEKRTSSEAHSKTIVADKLTQPSSNHYVLKGNAVMTQPGLVVLSDEIHHNQQTQVTQLKGQVELHQPDITITAEKATINAEIGKSKLQNTQYQLLPSRAHGKSESIKLNQQEQRAKLKHASLTTCPMDKNGDKDWDIKFDELEVNDQTRRVVGKNTTFYINDVPVFYTPYFNYPLDERASGLLFPEIGSYKSIFDDNRYQYIKVPYYFNIAPNMDDTLSAIAISQRGLALENEFRYTENSNNVLHSAEVTVTALHDQVVASKGLASLDANDNVVRGDKDANRWRIKLKANQRWNPELSSSVDWHAVSDESFFREIPVEETLTNASYKRRSARLDYRVGNLHAHARVLGYAQLLNFSDNYEKRPELGLSYYKTIGSLDFDVVSEYSDFFVPTSNHSRAEGKRFHLEPQLQHHIKKPYGYLTTTAKAYITQYQMDDNGFNPSNDRTIARTVPQLAVRGGLTFEKPVSILDHSLTQTLEPEVQLLSTPYLNQDDIALFDTTNRSLAFENLFALNRFSGADRIGDTRQISYAVTTRLLHQDGRQLAEAGIGQTAYLKNRKVQLNNGAADTEDFSDIFVKLGFNYQNWYFSSNSQYDTKTLRLTNANSRIKWQNAQHLAMINYSVYEENTEDEIDTLSVAINSKINPRWSTGLYSNYNLQERAFYETQLSLSYQSCCWSLAAIAERTQLTNGLYNDAIQLQFELTGISTGNNRFKDTLTDKLNF